MFSLGRTCDFPLPAICRHLPVNVSIQLRKIALIAGRRSSVILDNPTTIKSATPIAKRTANIL